MTINPFELTFPARVRFGRGRLQEIGRLAREFGQCALVVTGSSTHRAALLFDLLARSGVQHEILSVSSEPTVADVDRGVQLARKRGVDLVIGFGGGSAVDAAKAIAAMATNPGSLLDYLEVIGAGKPLTRAPLPFLAVPTTAGTGAEATRNAVLASPAHKVKVSLRSPLMLPKVAIIDPELTYGMPPGVTATTGLDALTQLIEAFVSSRANPLTDVLCRDGIARVASALPMAFAHASLQPVASPAPTPDHLDARENMALASLWSGIALANAGLGAVHGFAGPLGGMFDAPHGGICASLLPEVMRTNLRALRQRTPSHPAVERYAEVARLILQRDDATPEEGVEAIQRLCAALRIPSLGRYGVDVNCLPDLIAGARRASSMRANPVELTGEELTGIVRRSLE